MLLTIDVGNTQIVAGLYDGANLLHRFRLASMHERTADEYGVLLEAMLLRAGIDVAAIKAAAIGSVVPPLNHVIRRVCLGFFGVDPLVVGPGVKTGMAIRYENPREVGADRIVNSVAAFERFKNDEGGPHGVIVVDFGTATTFDVVTPDGAYMGGTISPGIVSSSEALFRAASKLPRVDLVVPEACLGRTTVHSMQSGILYGYVALVDGMVARLSAEIEFEPRVIATGGLATMLADHSTTIECVDPILTLEGLRLIHERNRNREL